MEQDEVAAKLADGVESASPAGSADAAMRDSATVDDDQDAPRQGTLAWLQLQEHVDFHGLEIPECHRCGDGLLHTEVDGRCRLIRADGTRCNAPATRLYGICLVHAGGGASDHAAISKLGHAAKARLRERRQLLGIGPRRVGTARQIARVEALSRADDIAAALLAPLDAEGLDAMQLQRSAVVILDAVEPLSTVTLDVQMPVDADAVSGMDWQSMQAMAAQLLGHSTVTVLDEASVHAALPVSSGS